MPLASLENHSGLFLGVGDAEKQHSGAPVAGVRVVSCLSAQFSQVRNGSFPVIHILLHLSS